MQKSPHENEFFEATADDVPALALLVNSAYRGESSRLGWTTEADFLDGQRTSTHMLLKEIREPGHTILCMRKNKELVGCVFLEEIKQRGGCYLGMLTIDPKRQSYGLGKLLLRAAEKFAKERGATWITLGVIYLRQELISWYERRGYRRTGETRPFPYGNEEFGIPKREDLHFVMLQKEI